MRCSEDGIAKFYKNLDPKEAHIHNQIRICMFKIFGNKISIPLECHSWLFKHWLIYVKGSLHTTIFSKYTELLQLKNVFRIFWNYFWNILKINTFPNKNQSYQKYQNKKVAVKNVADIDNNKLMDLLVIAGGSLLLSQERIKQRRKRRQ